MQNYWPCVTRDRDKNNFIAIIKIQEHIDILQTYMGCGPSNLFVWAKKSSSGQYEKVQRFKNIIAI